MVFLGCVQCTVLCAGYAREDSEGLSLTTASSQLNQVSQALPKNLFTTSQACLQRHGRAPDAISPIEFKFTCLTYKIRAWLHFCAVEAQGVVPRCTVTREIVEQIPFAAATGAIL